MTSRDLEVPQGGPPAPPAIARVSCIRCAFFLLRDESEAADFLGQESPIADWIAARTGRPAAGSLFPDTELRKRVTQETEEEWRAVLVHETLPASGDPPGYLDVLIYRWHDTATWLLEISCPLNDNTSPREALDRLVDLSADPLLPTSQFFLGESSFPRLTTAQPCIPQRRRDLARAWALCAHQGEEPGALLHTSVLQGRADLYAIPPSGSNGSWTILQIVDGSAADALDGLTGNELRQLESYAHKVQRETVEYRKGRADFHLQRKLLQESVLRWSGGEALNAQAENLDLLNRDLNQTSAVYLQLARHAPFLQDVQATLTLDLDNLDQRRSSLGMSAGEDDGIYGTRSLRGHRLTRQIDADVRYAGAMLNQARTVLGTIGGRLEIRRQELAQEAAQREEVAQSSLLQAQKALTEMEAARQRHVDERLEREAVTMRWLTLSLLALTLVLAVAPVHDGIVWTIDRRWPPVAWATLGVSAAVVAVLLLAIVLRRRGPE